MENSKKDKNMLTVRLDCIIGYVNSNVVADIGTDHAYVATELIKTNRAKRVIATDVNQGPLNAAIENIKKNNMENVIETRLGSGLSVLKKGEADTIIIAGMGGELICEIIKKDMKIAKEAVLVLQPMNAQYEVRKFLLTNGVKIIKEDIECEGERVYNIIIAEAGEEKEFWDDFQYHVPSYLTNNRNFKALYDKKKREFNKIVRGLEKSEKCDFEKLEKYRGYKNKLEKMRNECK